MVKRYGLRTCDLGQLAPLDPSQATLRSELVQEPKVFPRFLMDSLRLDCREEHEQCRRQHERRGADYL